MVTRDERVSRAQSTVHRIIPELLRCSPRAKHGVSQADLIIDPPPFDKTPTGTSDPTVRPAIQIRITSSDPLQAASNRAERPYATKRDRDARRRPEDAKSNVTIHNMSSLTRPGGGFLGGSNRQEEYLCGRTSLYPSLLPGFYPLPDIGGIYSPDVLVFRDTNAVDLKKRDRFFINVISAGTPRHPDNRGRYDEREVSCSCGVSYCDRDRDFVIRKMKAVLRMAQMNGTKHLVLGAWGCGGLNHPVKEVAKLWRKVITGSSRQRRPNVEQWEGIEEVIFSLPSSSHAREFRKVFDDVLAPDMPAPDSDSPTYSYTADSLTNMDTLISIATSLELQIDMSPSMSFERSKLKDQLRQINLEIAAGRADQAAGRDEQRDEDEDEDVEDDYVVSGFAGSDGEENSYYQVGGMTSDSDGSDTKSEVYEFRFSNVPGVDSQASHDEDELEDIDYSLFRSSPQLNAVTGWFKGRIEDLQIIKFGHGPPISSSSISPGSPLVRIESEPGDESAAVDGFLERYQGAEA